MHKIVCHWATLNTTRWFDKLSQNTIKLRTKLFTLDSHMFRLSINALITVTGTRNLGSGRHIVSLVELRGKNFAH